MDTKMRQMLQGIGLFSGRILSETEYSECLVSSGIVSNSDKPKGFTIVAGAFPDFIQALRAKQAMSTRVMAFESPCARMLLAVTLQVGSIQSRTLFDLEVSVTRAMLQAAGNAGKLRFLFITSDEAAALESHGAEVALPINPEAIIHLLNRPIGQGTARDAYERTVDMAMMAAHFLQDRTLVLIDGQPVPDSITLTDFTVEHIEAEVNADRTLH